MTDLIMTPMSGEEMLEYNPDARLLKYTQLYDFRTIDEAFSHFNKIILLYLIDSASSGHWTCLMRYPEQNRIEFFDSYGLGIDDEEKYVPRKLAHTFKEDYKKLSELLNKSQYKITYSKYKLQGSKSETCGRFVSLRLLEKKLTDDQFYNKYFRNINITPDEVVSKIINK